MDRRRVLVMMATLIGAGAVGYFATPDPDALPRGGDFTLRGAAGPVSLRDFRGQVVVLYFGYASCPDVCPVSLGLIGAALDTLPPEEAAKVKLVFVSLDPERDTPEALLPYAAHFHADAVGVTGTVAEVTEVATRYGITYRKHGVDSALGYVVDHTSATLIVSPEGRLVETLEHGTPPERIAEAVRRWTPHATVSSKAAPRAAETVAAEEAWVRAPAPGIRTTAAYFRLQNPGAAPQVLVRAGSPVAENVELHAVLEENGLTSMRPVERIEVPAGGEARLEPSGNHVMLIGLVKALAPGDTVPLTLTFADGSTREMALPVRE